MVDLVGAVTGIFETAVRQRLSSSLGVTPAVVDRLVEGGIGSLLAAVAGKSREPGGMKLLASVLDQQPADRPGVVAEAIGTSRQQGVVDDGVSAIGTLLGASAVGQIAGVLSKFASTGIGNARSALGLVMPAVLGVIGREREDRRLDAAGTVGLLTSQQQAISAAIPSALRPLLEDTGLLDTFDTVAAPPRGAGQSSPTRRHPDEAAQSQGLDFSWPGWIAAIAAACVMWWSVFGDRVMAFVTGARPPAVTHLIGPPERLIVGATDIGEETADTLALLNGILTGIRGDVTARLSLPKLDETSAALDRLRNLSAELTPDRRRQFASLVARRSEGLPAAIAAAEAAPGAAPVLRPVFAQLRARLAALAK